MSGIDLDVYGRGFDGIFGPGAERAGRRKALRLINAKRAAREQVRTGDYVEYDFYGRGDPRIFNVSSTDATSEFQAGKLDNAATANKIRGNSLLACFSRKMMRGRFQRAPRLAPSSSLHFSAKKEANNTHGHDAEQNDNSPIVDSPEFLSFVDANALSVTADASTETTEMHIATSSPIPDVASISSYEFIDDAPRRVKSRLPSEEAEPEVARGTVARALKSLSTIAGEGMTSPVTPHPLFAENGLPLPEQNANVFEHRRDAPLREKSLESGRLDPEVISTKTISIAAKDNLQTSQPEVVGIPSVRERAKLFSQPHYSTPVARHNLSPAASQNSVGTKLDEREMTRIGTLPRPQLSEHDARSDDKMPDPLYHQNSSEESRSGSSSVRDASSQSSSREASTSPRSHESFNRISAVDENDHSTPVVSRSTTSAQGAAGNPPNDARRISLTDNGAHFSGSVDKADGSKPSATISQPETGHQVQNALQSAMDLRSSNSFHSARESKVEQRTDREESGNSPIYLRGGDDSQTEDEYHDALDEIVSAETSFDTGTSGDQTDMEEDSDHSSRALSSSDVYSSSSAGSALDDSDQNSAEKSASVSDDSSKYSLAGDNY